MYIGARYIAGQPVTVGRGGSRILRKGDILKSMPEQEAIGRADFEPVYDEVKKEKKHKKDIDIIEEG